MTNLKSDVGAWVDGTGTTEYAFLRHHGVTMSITADRLWSRRPLSSTYRRAATAIPMSLRRRVRYYRTFDRALSLRKPRSFTEKVTWRMLNDRRDILVDTCDKARMKQHAERTAPSSVRVPRLRWQGTDLEQLRNVELPEHWVLKPNHRSSLVLFGTGKPDIDSLRTATDGWLDRTEWVDGGEWAYSKADASFVVEDRIGVPGTDLVDYKFYVFDGIVRLVQTDTNRFTSHGSRVYSPSWEPLAVTAKFPSGPEVPRPEMLDEMIEAAATIAAGFDFIRVDLYAHEGEIWFGELTPYPGSGLVGWNPESLDFEAGSWWILPDIPTNRRAF